MRSFNLSFRTPLLLAMLIALGGFSSAAASLPLSIQPPVVTSVGNNFKIKDWTVNEGYYGRPSIAFDGTNFLIVWCQDSSKNAAMHCTSIYAARVGPAGTLVDPQGIAISTANQEVGTPSVVFDGVNFSVFWSGMRNNIYEVYAASIKPDGTVINPEGVVLTTGADPKPYRVIGVAFDGTNTLVAYRTNITDNIRAMRISRQLSNLDNPTGFAVASLGAHYYPAVAFDGTNFMIVWHDGRHNAFVELDIYGARVTKAGQVLDPDGFPIYVQPGFADQRNIGFDGQNYWVAWFEQDADYANTVHGKILATRVSPAGTVLDTPPIFISDRAYGQNGPQLACQNGYCLVVWFMGLRNNGADFRLMDVYAERLGQSGQVLDRRPIPVSTAVGNQWGPNVGYGAGHFLVAWKELNSVRGGQAGLWGQILAEQVVPNSPPLAPAPRPYGPATWVQESVDPLPVVGWPYMGDGIAFDLDHSDVFNSNVMKVYQNGYWKTDYQTAEGGIYASWGRSASHFWVGGWCGLTYEFVNNAWRDWGCLNSPGPLADDLMVTGLWGPGDQVAWASSVGGKLLQFDPNAVSPPVWHSLSSGQPYDLHEIWGAAANDIYAVGERGTIVHYNGLQWAPLPNIPTDQTLSAIWGSGPKDIFAVGDWGVILHYDGTAWTEQDSGVRLHLYDVWGFDAKNVYAVGQSGTILHYDGSTWIPENSGVTADLQSVWGAQGIKGGQAVKAVWTAGDNLLVEKSTTITPAQHTFLPFVHR